MHHTDLLQFSFQHVLTTKSSQVTSHMHSLHKPSISGW